MQRDWERERERERERRRDRQRQVKTKPSLTEAIIRNKCSAKMDHLNHTFPQTTILQQCCQALTGDAANSEVNNELLSWPGSHLCCYCPVRRTDSYSGGGTPYWQSFVVPMVVRYAFSRFKMSQKNTKLQRREAFLRIKMHWNFFSGLGMPQTQLRQQLTTLPDPVGWSGRYSPIPPTRRLTDSTDTSFSTDCSGQVEVALWLSW